MTLGKNWRELCFQRTDRAACSCTPRTSRPLRHPSPTSRWHTRRPCADFRW